MVKLPPRIYPREQPEQRRRWLLFWGKWSLWITVSFSSFLIPLIVLHVLQFGFQFYLTPASQAAVVTAGLGISGGGLVTLASWIVVRHSSMQAWGEHTSILTGLAVSAGVGLIVGLGLLYADNLL